MTPREGAGSTPAPTLSDSSRSRPITPRLSLTWYRVQSREGEPTCWVRANTPEGLNVEYWTREADRLTYIRSTASRGYVQVVQNCGGGTGDDEGLWVEGDKYEVPTVDCGVTR